jgi:hypothetical protein
MATRIEQNCVTRARIEMADWSARLEDGEIVSCRHPHRSRASGPDGSRSTDLHTRDGSSVAPVRLDKRWSEREQLESLVRCIGQKEQDDDARISSVNLSTEREGEHCVSSGCSLSYKKGRSRKGL